MNGVVEFVWTDRAKPIVEVGIGDSRVDTPTLARWDISEWDDPSSTWVGTEPLWDAITGDVHQIQCELGRKRATDAFEPARLSVTVSNETGWADQKPGDDPRLLSLRSGRAIRVGVDHVEFGIVWKFRGVIDTISPRYDAEFADVVDITAVCALGDSGRGMLPELAVAVGAGELAGSRMHRILNAQKWPVALRAIEQTGVTVLGTVLGRQSGDLMGITVDSVGGALYGDTAGRVAFRGRDWQTYDLGDEVDGIIGNGSTVVGGAFEFPGGAGNYLTVPLLTPTDPDVIYAAECVRPPNPAPGSSGHVVSGNPFTLKFNTAGLVATIRCSDGTQLSTPTATYAALEAAGFPDVGETVQLIALFTYLGSFVVGWRTAGRDLADPDGWNGAASVDATGKNASHTVTTWYLGASTAGADDGFVGAVYRWWLSTSGLQVDVNGATDVLTDADTFEATTGQTVTVHRTATAFADWTESGADLMEYIGPPGDWDEAATDLMEWTA